MATAAVAVGLSVWLRWGDPPPLAAPPHRMWLLAALLLGVSGSVYYGDVLGERRGQKDILVTITPAFHVAAALLLPVPLALCVPLATVAALQVRRRPAAYKQVFNGSVYALGVVACGPVYTALIGPGLPTVNRFAVAASTSSLLYGAIDIAAFVLYLRLASGLRARESQLIAIVEKSSQVTFGVLLAAAWCASPVLVGLFVPMGVTLQRAVVFRSVERASRTDAKTGLMNDRSFRLAAERVLARRERTGEPAALLMLDLDHLREINNEHGHVVGDMVIRLISDVLRDHLRERDLAARFGGEEFAVLLPSTSAPEAEGVAERIRYAFATASFTTGDRTLSASVSVGVASASSHASSLEELTRAADAALYAAKSAGRNTVRVFEADAACGMPTPVPAPRGSADEPCSPREP